MRSISQFEGPLVKSLSASVRELLEDEIADRRQKLVVQLNRHIDKNRDRLHVSLSDLLPEFGEGSRADCSPDCPFPVLTGGHWLEPARPVDDSPVDFPPTV